MPFAKMIGHDYQTYEHAQQKFFGFTVAFLRENESILEQIQPDYRTLGRKPENGDAATMRA